MGNLFFFWVFCIFFGYNQMTENGTGGRGPFAPTFDGKGSSFQDFEQRVALWNRTTEIPPDRRASQLVLHMEPFARQICLQNGVDSFMEGVAVVEVLQVPKQYFLTDFFRIMSI